MRISKEKEVPVGEVDENSGSTQRQLSRTREWAGNVADSPLLGGEIVKVTFPNTSDSVRVVHKLGRRYVGYFPVRNDSAAIIYEDPAVSQSSPEQEVKLRCDVSGAAVSIYVF